jgi:hypothetical protein
MEKLEKRLLEMERRDSNRNLQKLQARILAIRSNAMKHARTFA